MSEADEKSLLTFAELGPMSMVAPRKAIRKIVDIDPGFAVDRLIIYSFLANSLSSAGLTLDMLALTIGLNILLGFVSVYGTALLLWLTGRFMNGKATFKELVAAMAWSLVPFLIGSAIACLISAIGGQSGELLSILVTLIAFGWSAKIAIWMVAEVQGFTLWQSILNNTYAMLIVLLPFIPYLPKLLETFKLLQNR